MATSTSAKTLPGLESPIRHSMGWERWELMRASLRSSPPCLRPYSFRKPFVSCSSGLGRSFILDAGRAPDERREGGGNPGPRVGNPAGVDTQPVRAGDSRRARADRLARLPHARAPWARAAVEPRRVVPAARGVCRLAGGFRAQFTGVSGGGLVARAR